MTPDNEKWIIDALTQVRDDVRAIRELMSAYDERLRVVEQKAATLGVKMAALIGGLWITVKLFGGYVADLFRSG